jgi:hypothetical protein
VKKCLLEHVCNGIILAMDMAKEYGMELEPLKTKP